MTIQELFTKWGFDIDLKPLQGVEKGIDSLRAKVNLTGLAATGAAASIFGFAKFTADAGDHILHTAEMLGIGVENLQKLQFAAKLANVSNEEFAGSMRFLSKNLLEAQKGSGDAVEAFRKLKLDPRQFKSSDAALRAISDRFAMLPEGPQRAAIAMQLFGRSGANLVPLLKEGSKGLDEAGKKAEKYGILTEEQAKAGDEFNDTLEETHAAMIGIRNVIGNALIPQLKPLIEAFNDYLATNRKILAQNIGKVFDTLSRIIRIVMQAATGAVSIFRSLTSSIGGMEKVLQMVNSALDFILGNPMFIKILGATTLALYGLATAFGAVNAAALVIPLTIAAIVGVIALLVDDFVAFSQGRDSAFGLLVNFFKTEFPNAFKFFASSFQFVIDIFKVFYNNLSIVLGVLYKIGSYIVDVLANAFGKLGQAIGFIVDKLGLAKLFSAIGNGLSTGAGFVASATSGLAASTAATAGQVGVLGSLGGMTPQTAPAGAAPMSGIMQDNAVNVNINVPPGSDAKAIGAAAKSGVESGLDSVLRSTKRTFKKGVEY